MPTTTTGTRGNVGEIRNELAKRYLLTKPQVSLGQNELQVVKKKRKTPIKLRLLGAIVTEGIRVNDLKLNIFEMKKEYEVHASFENDENIKHRLDVAMSYLGDEGYFDKPKEVKIYGKAWGKRSNE
mgnify:FL=1|jgi:hypothetical protein|tara:strand:+ start:93 stop:470 length:378 start_codon:yes stop_codon:yes gene_type:complete